MQRRNLRLTAAVTTAALGASLATPLIGTSAASSSAPALPDITAALQAAGISSGNAQTITTELGNLQSSGSALPTGGLSTLDSAVGGLVGGVLQTLLNALNLLGSPGSASNLTALLSDLESHSSGAPAPVQAALQELEASITSAGLGSLLSQAPGVSPAQITAALQALADTQSLPLGSSVPSGGLSPVADLLSTAAGQTGISGTPLATALNNLATTLNGGLTPAQLETAISQLQSAASGLSGGQASLTSALDALAAQLGDSGSVFGGLGSLGSPPSSSTVTQALAALSGLPSQAPGSSVPGGSLSPLAGVLTTIAGEPGVSGTPAATTLTNVASVLSNPSDSLSPAQLQTLIGLLQTAAGQLPAPLGGSNGVVTGIAGQLSTAGSLLPGTTSTTTGSQTASGSQTTTSGSQTTSTTSATSTQAVSSTGGGGTPGSGGGSTGSHGSPGSSGKPTSTKPHGGTVVVAAERRKGEKVTFVYTCTASPGLTCTVAASASQIGYVKLTRHFRVRGGAWQVLTFSLKRAKHVKPSKRHRKITLIVHSGRYRLVRAL